MERKRGFDRAVEEPQWLIRAVTIVIIGIGIAIVAYAVTRPEARRERAMGALAVGDSTSRVRDRLGSEPTVCPAGDLGHLQGRFPPGWSAAAQERAIERLAEETAERWVYPLDPNQRAACSEVENVTEVGVGRTGRVVWLIPLAGRHPLVLPDTLQPGTFTEIPDA